MFHTPKTSNNKSEGVQLTCPPPPRPRPNPNFANLPSTASAGMTVTCSSSDQQPTSALQIQRRPAPLLSLSSHQHQSSTLSTSTFSSLASDRPSPTPTTGDESFASSSIGDEQEFFLTAPGAGIIRPAVRYATAPVAVRNNDNHIVNTVSQGHHPVIRLQPRRSSSMSSACSKLSREEDCDECILSNLSHGNELDIILFG